MLRVACRDEVSCCLYGRAGSSIRSVQYPATNRRHLENSFGAGCNRFSLSRIRRDAPGRCIATEHAGRQ